MLNSISAQDSTNIEKQQEISQILQNKLDTILERFYKKLDMKISNVSKKIAILEKINFKIKKVKIKYYSNIRIINILNYLENNISKKIKIYEDLQVDKSITIPLYWININWSFLPELDDKKINLIKSLHPWIIRYPGGTVSQYWDWEKWVSSKPWKRVAHKLDDLLKVQKATNAKVIFVLNMISKDLNNQIKMLKTAQSMWIKIEYIEMWNEFYLVWEKHKVYVQKFPTAWDYVNTLNIWTKKIKEEFPNVKIWVVMLWRKVNNPRWKDWNKIVGNNAKNFDAFVYHIYSKWDTEKAVEDRILNYKNAKFQDNSKETWITEYGAWNTTSIENKVKLTKKLTDFVRKEASVSLLHFLYKKIDDIDSFALIKGDFSWFTKLGQLYLEERGK